MREHRSGNAEAVGHVEAGGKAGELCRLAPDELWVVAAWIIEPEDVHRHLLHLHVRIGRRQLFLTWWLTSPREPPMIGAGAWTEERGAAPKGSSSLGRTCLRPYV